MVRVATVGPESRESAVINSLLGPFLPEPQRETPSFGLFLPSFRMGPIDLDCGLLVLIGRFDRNGQRNDGDGIACEAATNVPLGSWGSGQVGRNDEIPLGGLSRNAVLSIEIDVDVIETAVRSVVVHVDDNRISIRRLSAPYTNEGRSGRLHTRPPL